MYMRFVTPLVDPDTRVECGYFRSAWYLYQNGAPQWVLSELEREFAWFSKHLPIPGRLGRVFKRRRSIWGICWFAPSFDEGISRAHYCAWLLEEGGLPVKVIKVARLREIIWHDSRQIVSKPTASTPKAFH